MRYIYILVCFLLVISCKSASELLDDGNYKAAFNKALNEVQKGNDVEQNTEVLKKASNYIAADALKKSKKNTSSKNIKDWIKAQGDLFAVVEDLGKANELLDGLINEPYDELCSAKKEIDYKIVKHYNDEGLRHLDSFKNGRLKLDARNAYYSFENCEKYGGQEFFPSLTNMKDYTLEQGVVYYTSRDLNNTSRQFLKPLPKDAEYEADCKINIDHGFVTFTTQESVNNNKQTKNIVTGQETIIDTSGNVTHQPIYENVEAVVITKKITVTGSANTSIYSKNITGNCTVKSRSYTTSLTDTYEEISITGDDRALTHPVITKQGEPAFFRSNLKDEVIKKADCNIGI